MIKLTAKDTVLFIGDSITHGARGYTMDLNHIFGHGFPSIVCGRLGADNYGEMPRFVNKGISGDTAQNVYSRLSVDLLAYKPTVVNLLCGVNDACKSAELPLDMAVRKYIETVDAIMRDTFELLPNVTFFLCEPFFYDVRNQEAPYENIPHPFCAEPFVFDNSVRDEALIEKRKERIAGFQAALPALAEKYGAIYVPFQDVFDKAAETTPASYFIWDNIHPTMVGHQLMADRWFEIAEAAFAAKK